MKRIVAILMIVLLLLSACSTATLEGAGKEIEDTIANAADADNKYVKMVKGGYRVDDPSVTYEDAFSAFFGTPRWKYFESTENQDVVEFTGDCTYQDVPVKARIQFVVDEENGTFDATYLAFNEVPQNAITLAAVIEKAFEEARVAGVKSGESSLTDTDSDGSIVGADAGAADSTDSLKQILYNGVPVYSYLGRSLDDVQGEFGDYEYFKFGDTFQGKEIFFCRCDMLVFGYVEDRDDEIVYISAYPDEVSLNGSTLDLNPDDLVDLLPSPYFNEFDYDAFSYFVKYSMSDMPISVTFTMPDAGSEAYDVEFSLDS